MSGSAPARPAGPAAAAPPGATPARRHFALFDSLRGLAAMMVLVYHVVIATDWDETATLGRFALQLNIGVAIFFVLSGFLLYRPFVTARAEGRRAPSARGYARRRALRILPAYWVALTGLALLLGLPGVLTGDWWRYYGLLQIYDADTTFTGLNPAWSLCVEVSFYALLPLYAWCAARLLRGRPFRTTVRIELAALAVAALATLVVRRVVIQGAGPLDPSPMLEWTLVGTFDWFCVGMALAIGSVAIERAEHRPRWVGYVERHPLAVWGAALALYLVTSIPRSNPLDIHHIASAVIGALFVLPAVFGDGLGGLPRRLLRAPVIAWLGVISYGVFLWHEPFTDWFWEGRLDAVGGTAGMLLVLAATVAVSVVLGALSYYLVERPFMRRSARRRPATAPAPGAPAPEPVTATPARTPA